MCCFISYSHPSSTSSPPLQGGVCPPAHVLKPLMLGFGWRLAASRSHTLNRPLFTCHLEQGGQLSHPLMLSAPSLLPHTVVTVFLPVFLQNFRVKPEEQMEIKRILNLFREKPRGFKAVVHFMASCKENKMWDSSSVIRLRFLLYIIFS